jgi:hypothetical protein
MDILQTIFTADYLPLVRRVVWARSRSVRAWQDREDLVSVAVLRAWERFCVGYRAAAKWCIPICIAIYAWKYAFQRRYRLKQSDVLSTHRRVALGQVPLSEVDRQRSVSAELPTEVPGWVPDRYRAAAEHAMSGGWLANPTIRALKRAYRETH